MEFPLLTFSLMALVVVITPGPTVLLALSNGSRFGFASAGYGILGAALSDAVLISAAALGLGAILAASAFWFNVVKSIGIVYLLWVGIQMMRSSGKLAVISSDVAVPSKSVGRQTRAIFSKSLLVAVTNPKGYLFFTAFLPQFLDPSKPLLSQYVILGAIFIFVDVLVMCAYAGLGVKAVRFLSDRRALWIDRTCGGLLIALAIALTFVRRTPS